VKEQVINSLAKKVSLFTDQSSEAEKVELVALLREAIAINSNRVREQREIMVGLEKSYKEVLKTVPEGTSWLDSKNSKFISYLKLKKTLHQESINALLKDSDLFLSTSARIHRKQHLFANDVQLDKGKQENYVCLRDGPAQLLDLEKNPENFSLLKQRTEEWSKWRQESHVTGSTMFNAVGLGTVKDQRTHFDVYINKKKAPEIPENIKQYMEHGTMHEKDALATVLGKVMPGLFPNHTLIEDGCERIKTPGNKVMIVSGDGTMQQGSGGSAISLELKCPLPGKQHTTDLPYSLPLRYSTQVLAQMNAKKQSEYVFVAYNSSSATVIQGNNDPSLWQKIIGIFDATYANDILPR
jgi:hypothetical protein